MFSLLFVKAIESSEMDDNVEKRVANLNDYFAVLVVLQHLPIFAFEKDASVQFPPHGKAEDGSKAGQLS